VRHDVAGQRGDVVSGADSWLDTYDGPANEDYFSRLGGNGPAPVTRDRMNGHADETPWPAHDEAPNDRPPREPDDCDEPTPIREVCATEPAVAAPDDWPDPPAAAAFYGLPGRVVEFVNPFSEADPVAVLGTFLTVFGCVLNTSPHAMVGPERHPARLFLALVGRSSVSRKGTSWAPIRELFHNADPEFIRSRIVSGLGSGEGLIYRVRDGDDKDPGVTDKRALVFAPEFATILRVMGRQGSILSGTIKEAFDTGNLENAVKTNPMKATGAHVSIIAHTTAEEMARDLTDTDARSGFGNRFIYLAVRRSKLLPSPPRWNEVVVADVAREITRALEAARRLTYIERDAEARARWDAGYAHLTRDRYGLAGILTSRAEALVLRLSLLYALTDGSREIRRPHLDAALALWEYAERSAQYIFGDRTGDPIADRVLDAVSDGRMNRTQISDLFDRHLKGPRIGRTLDRLASEGRITRTEERTPGRSVEWIEAVRSAKEAKDAK
jgi:Protein of unknown function (DUF3987)